MNKIELKVDDVVVFSTESNLVPVGQTATATDTQPTAGATTTPDAQAAQ